MEKKGWDVSAEIIVSSFVWHVPFSLVVLGRAGCPAELPPSALAARGAEGIWQLLLFPLFFLSLSPFFAFPFLRFSLFFQLYHTKSPPWLVYLSFFLPLILSGRQPCLRAVGLSRSSLLHQLALPPELPLLSFTLPLGKSVPYRGI